MAEQLKIGETIGFYLKKIARIQAMYINSVLQQFGLTKSQFEILAFLNESYSENSENIVTQKDIEDFFGISHVTVIGLLHRLQNKGFIEISINEKDKRYRNVTLTKKSINLNQIITNHVKEAGTLFEQSLTGEQIIQLKEILSTIYNNLKNKTDTIMNPKTKKEEVQNEKNNINIRNYGNTVYTNNR